MKKRSNKRDGDELLRRYGGGWKGVKGRGVDEGLRTRDQCEERKGRRE